MPRVSWQEIDDALGEFVHGDPDEAKERKRRRIVAAASELFQRHGYRKTSVDQIADGAHVSKGTIYLYFKSKSDILVHAVALEKAQYLQHLRPILDDPMPPEDRLRAYLEAVFLLVERMPLVSRLARGDGELKVVLEEMDPDLEARSDALGVRLLGGLLAPFAQARGWSEQDVLHRAYGITTIVQTSSALMDERARHGLDAEGWAAVLADMLVAGLTAPGGDR